MAAPDVAVMKGGVMPQQTFLCARRLAMIAVVALLSSCTIPPELILYNNTGERLTVASGDHSQLIEPKKEAKVPFPFGDKSLSITCASNTWTYTLKYPPHDFCGPSSHLRIKSQVESNGFIYVFPKDVGLPGEDLSRQPEGFPVKPKEAEGQNPR